MLNPEQKKQFSEILDELGNTLEITESQYNAAVKSYQAVGDWLSKDDSTLAPFKPVILPQGSFMLGTMIKPVSDDDDLDIDLVCELTGKKESWTQSDVKKEVGDRLKAHDIYKKLLDDEGRRCWTLEYRKHSQNEDQYHMDILPSIVDKGYRLIVENSFKSELYTDFDKLAIRITDKEKENYKTETQIFNWLKSNPFGYGRWFYNRATIRETKLFSINESVKPVPKYQSKKLPLQRVIQILKRHRDMMFDGDEDKPISIIITTLASHAYQKETDIIDALANVISNMPNYIDEKTDPITLKKIKWIGNPVNQEENFADKWVEKPKKQENFYKWMERVQVDVNNIIAQKGKGLQVLNEAFQKPFGKDVVTKTFSQYAEKTRLKRENKNLKMAAGTGMLGSTGRTTIPNHTNFGKNE